MLNIHHFRNTTMVIETDKRGYNIINVVEYWNRSPFVEGTIEDMPARHGHGVVAKLTGNVLGFYIEVPNQKSIKL